MKAMSDVREINRRTGQEETVPARRDSNPYGSGLGMETRIRPFVARILQHPAQFVARQITGNNALRAKFAAFSPVL